MRLLLFVVSFYPVLLWARIDYMKFSSGQEKNSFDKDIKDKCFIPFDKAFKRVGDFLIFAIPAETEAAMAFSGFKEVKVEPSRIYSLKLTALGAERVYMYLRAYFISDNPAENSIQTLYRHVFFLNQNGMTTIEREFAVPPGVRSMILSVSVMNDAGNKTLTPGNKIIIKNLIITEKCPVAVPPEALAGKNLLPYGDFRKFPLGEFNEIFRGAHSDPNKKWPKFDAQVVELDGVKCLKITRTDKSYPYPFFTTEKFSKDIKNCFVKATATVRGEGPMRLGLWWERQGYFSPDYMNRVAHQLDGKWTTVTEIRACLSPLVTNADLSITSYSDAVIYVKDISVELIKP